MNPRGGLIEIRIGKKGLLQGVVLLGFRSGHSICPNGKQRLSGAYLDRAW